MFANFLIGLREGIEAAIVVSILLAYLVKTGRESSRRPVWLGVGVAVAMSLGFGALLTFTSSNLTFRQQEAFGGVLSIIAVGFVTWMIFWMKRTARNIKRELHGQLDQALLLGSYAVAVVAFLAVAREGLETSLFLWAAIQSSGSSTAPLIGASLGLATAVAMGWAFYRGALRINLGKFFTYTGAGLVVVAAGVLAYAIHDLQEAALLPGLDHILFDVSAAIPPGSVHGTLLKGIFNFSPAPSQLEALAWIAYLVPVMYLFFKPAKQPAVEQARVDAVRV